MKFKSLLCTLILLVVTGCLFEEKEESMTKENLIPRKILFGNPERTQVRLSPDGKYMAYLAPWEGVLNVHVMEVGKPNTAKPVTFDKGKGVQGYNWTFLPSHMLYVQDTDGDENTIVYLLDLDTLKTQAVTEKASKAFVQNITPDYPEEILIGVNDRNPSYFDVYKVNLQTGVKELIYQNDEFIGFIEDDNNIIRFALKSAPDGSREVYEFVDNKPSVLFKTIAFEDADTSHPIGLDKAAKRLFMLDSTGRDTNAIYEIDIATKQSNVIAQSDDADISAAIIHPTTYEIQGYSYEYARVATQVIDPAIAADVEYLKTVSNGDLNIISRTQKDDLWIVAYSSADAPISYYQYDRLNKQAEFLFTQNSKLEGLPLNPMFPVIIRSRDGLELVSYLSVPKDMLKSAEGFAVNEPLPLILNVHGGPQARDSWGYNAGHQWLSNRGFAVLSVNYRGSTGFGKQFIRAGDGQWAGKMHEDLLDAVKWAVDNGITTSDKVAIYGGSYGGYSTLVGLTMTPEVFACGVDIVGPSNLITLYDSVPPYWEPFKVSLKRKFGGDPHTPEGAEIARQKSPITHVDNIVRPLLIAQGANDPRVKQAESDQIVSKMVEKGIPVTYLLYPNEGHGFARPENRTSFYAIAEQFLGKCFGVKTEKVGDDLVGSSLQILQGADLIEQGVAHE